MVETVDGPPNGSPEDALGTYTTDAALPDVFLRRPQGGSQQRKWTWLSGSLKQQPTLLDFIQQQTAEDLTDGFPEKNEHKRQRSQSTTPRSRHHSFRSSPLMTPWVLLVKFQRVSNRLEIPAACASEGVMAGLVGSQLSEQVMSPNSPFLRPNPSTTHMGKPNPKPSMKSKRNPVRLQMEQGH